MSGFYEREQRSDDVAYRLLREEVEKEKEKNKDTEAGGVKETETETNEEPKKKKTLKETLEEFQPQIMIFNVLTPDRKSPKLKGDHAVRIVTLKQMLEDSVDDIVGKLKLKSQLQSTREHRLEGVTFPGYDETPDYLKKAIDKIVDDDNNLDLQFDKEEKEIERARGDDGKLTGDVIELTNFITVFKAALIEKQEEAGVSNFADDDDEDALTQFMNWAFGSAKTKSDEEPVVVNMALPKMRTPRRNNNHNSAKMGAVSEAIEELQQQEQGAIEQEQEEPPREVIEIKQEQEEPPQEVIEIKQEQEEPPQEDIKQEQEVEDTKADRKSTRLNSSH